MYHGQRQLAVSRYPVQASPRGLSLETLCKKEGILLYSTCTINKNENEENVKWFLDQFPNFSFEPIFYGKLDNINYGENGVTVLPDKYMDGFFIAKFKRIR
jgi:16S rRNA (cytosine967-C5)-methyltransferase